MNDYYLFPALKIIMTDNYINDPDEPLNHELDDYYPPPIGKIVGIVVGLCLLIILLVAIFIKYKEEIMEKVNKLLGRAVITENNLDRYIAKVLTSDSTTSTDDGEYIVTPENIQYDISIILTGGTPKSAPAGTNTKGGILRSDLLGKMINLVQ